MKTKRTQFLYALLVLLVSGAVQAAPPQTPPVVPAHVMIFHLEKDGVVQPESWRQSPWWDFRPATEDDILDATAEPREVRTTHHAGHIGVRAIDISGRIVLRTVVEVHLEQVIESDESHPGRTIPIDNPPFMVVVPRTARLIQFEGWLPATHSTFDLEDVAARYGQQATTGRKAPEAIAPNALLTSVPNRVNILIIGDGYLDPADRAKFDTDARAVEQAIAKTEPYRRYRQFLNVQYAFVASHVRGAYHPTSCPVTLIPPTTLEDLALTHDTAFHAYFCADNVNERVMATSPGFVQRALPNLVSGAAPNVVLILSNDPEWGGGGGGFAIYPVASTNPASAYSAMHEMGHVYGYTNLADEYGGGVGFNPCTEPNCRANITTFGGPPSLGALKWARWVDVTPLPVCAQNGGADGEKQTCTVTGIGAYEGAGGLNNNVWRPDFDCLMRHVDARNGNPVPGFCSICKEEHIRTFYRMVNPVLDVLESQRLATAARHIAPPIQIGSPITLGVSLLGFNGGADWKVTWSVDGSPVSGDNGGGLQLFTYVPVTATTHRIQMDVEDPTDMLRTDNAHRAPPSMKQRFAWYVDAASRARATSSGTSPVIQQGPPLIVPKGTKRLNVSYLINTSELGGGRPGDSWSVTVDYAGASAAARAATSSTPLFHDENIASSPKDNLPHSASFDVDATAGDVTVLLTVSVTNLETSDFLPTTIDASLWNTPPDCGSQCDFCASHPDDASCPLPFTILSADVLPIENSSRTPNHGDSTYNSLGEKIQEGRLVRLKLQLPKTFTSLHLNAVALDPFNNPLTPLRDTTWYGGPYTDPRSTAEGLDQDGRDFLFNVAPKTTFTKDPSVPITPPEDQWAHAIKFRITATLMTGDGRSGTASVDVDNVISGSTPTDPVLLPRPLHALWHTRKSGARWHFWSSVANNRWLEQTQIPFNMPDRVADEDAVTDTPPGHEFGTGITEVPFFPKAHKYDVSPDYGHYFGFRTDANAALDGTPNVTQAQQQAARDELVTWITATRSHLELVLADYFVSSVRVGDGAKCGWTFPKEDRLPDGWLTTLLVNGTITDANGNVLLDLSTRVGGAWNPVNVGKLVFDCVENQNINILIDRCKIGEARGPCTTGRPPGTGRHTIIIAPPQSTTIAAGQLATLNVTADGTDLHYQWYSGPVYNYNEPVPSGGANQIVVSPSASTAYWVLVTGLDGTAVASATVTVTGTGAPCNTPPVITHQPPPEIIITTGQAAFTVVSATGDGLHYQWYTHGFFEDIPIPGATLPSFTTSEPGICFVRVTNACGSVDSSTTTVLMGSSCGSPSAGGYFASSTSITAGQSITLYVFPGGRQPVSIVWYQILPDGVSTPIGTSTQLTVVPPKDQTQYVVGLSNECGSTVAQPITITVCTPPVITVQPVQPPPFTAFGQTAFLTVTAEGSNLHYTWFAGGAQMAGDSPTIAVGAPPAAISYTCTVSNECGSVDTVSIVINRPCSPPVMNVQPQGGTVVRGQSFTLAASAFGSSPQFQWLVKTPSDTAFTPLTGATQASVTVTPAVDQTQYRLHVFNDCGTADSAIATLTVTEPCFPPSITQQPQSQSIAAGATVTLTATARGTSPMTVQWWRLPIVPGALLTQISGATSTSLVDTPSADETQYRAIFTNACGQQSTSVASVTLIHPCVPPQITQQPVAPAFTSFGQTQQLTIVATGTNLHYAWSAAGSPLPDDAPSIVIGAPAAALDYVCVVSNDCGSVTSNAIVIVPPCTSPAIVQQPQSRTITAGESATLSVAAVGTDPLTVTWFTDAGVTAGSGMSVTVTPSATMTYYAVVTNGCGNARSISVTVTVNSACIAASITQQPFSQSVDAGQSAVLTVVATGTPPVTVQWYTLSGTPLGSGSSITVAPAITTDYYAMVTNACGGVRSVTATITVNPCVAPQITAQPQPQAIAAGQAVTLTVAATGSRFDVRWYNQSGALVGQTQTVTFLPVATISYYAVVSNGCGTVQTDTVTITVNQPCTPPTVTQNPQGATVTAGTAATLIAGASGTDLTFTWYDEFANLIGGGASITFTPAVTRSYYCIVSNACGSVQTTSALVTVNPACNVPVITGDPMSTTITRGESATLHVFAGGASIVFQWYEANGAPIGVASPTGNALTVSPSTTTGYYAVATNECGSARSATATVTVNPPPCIAPTITQQPQSQTITRGQSVALSIAATGTDLQAQWYQQLPTDPFPQAVIGANLFVLSVGGSDTPSGTVYTIRVFNGCGSVTSSPAVLTIQ